MPGYFQRAVLTSNHRYAILAFGIRLMPLQRQHRVIEQMRAALDPPRGVSAQLAGLPVLGADAEGSLSSVPDRLLMLLDQPGRRRPGAAGGAAALAPRL